MKEELEKYFYHDPTSHSGLRWNIDICNAANVIVAFKDSVAGNLHKSKNYYVVKVKGKSYYVHRIVMILNGYNVGRLFIDHINGNRSDNTLENLRIVNRTINARNQKKNTRNTSGLTGIRWRESCNGWVVAWTSQEGKTRQKLFTIFRYNTKNLALEAAKTFRTQKLQELGNYTERHGT